MEILRFVGGVYFWAVGVSAMNGHNMAVCVADFHSVLTANLQSKLRITLVTYNENK